MAAQFATLAIHNVAAEFQPQWGRSSEVAYPEASPGVVGSAAPLIR